MCWIHYYWKSFFFGFIDDVVFFFLFSYQEIETLGISIQGGT